MSTFRESALFVLLLSCFLFGSHSAAQSPGSRDPRSASEIEWENQQRANAQKKLSEQRQRDIKNDTDKLLQLATELKQYVDKTNQNVLSLDVVKKADQIERLAKAVKDKMKGQ
ncbi:MAG TPA: hypothetical protein VKG65_11400 [Terriglobales bacterium]|nr:hypothetical protein [Terriglobales bacterium]